MDSVPVWIGALVLTVVAPWCVQAYARLLEERSRKRTVAILPRIVTAREKGAGADDTQSAGMGKG